MLSIEEAFGCLPNPHSQPSPHDLREFVMIALRAILSAADSRVVVQIWGESKSD
ncbi:hypothetical protein [Burkholderia ubonensis]|uniref:hypothetical protein n=1 Tax=Burkholderia ubonensis TaxID=101571 RepID=UPI000ADBA654|nr:hypothetical protein [Burkholderia ubonensis]